MTALEPPQLSPEELARRCQNGSVEAFEALVEAFEDRIFHYLWQMTGDRQDAEDLTQETFLKAFRAILRYDPRQSFGTWLYIIAKRTAFNHFRSRKMKQNIPLPEREADLDHPARLLEQKESGNALWVLARQLKARQFEALWLRYGEGFSIHDVARILGTNSIYAKVLLHRGRSELRRLFTRAGIDFRQALGVFTES